MGQSITRADALLSQPWEPRGVIRDVHEENVESLQRWHLKSGMEFMKGIKSQQILMHMSNEK